MPASDGVGIAAWSNSAPTRRSATRSLVLFRYRNIKPFLLVFGAILRYCMTQ